MFWTLNYVAHLTTKSLPDVLHVPISSPEALARYGRPTVQGLEWGCTEHFWKYGIVAYLATSVPQQAAPCHSLCETYSKKKLFPKFIAESCTNDLNARNFMIDYGNLRYNDTRFRFFQLGLRSLREAWILQDGERRDEEVAIDVAYSC